MPVTLPGLFDEQVRPRNLFRALALIAIGLIPTGPVLGLAEPSPIVELKPDTQSLSLTGDLFMGKPVDGAELAAAIESLGQRQRQREPDAAPPL